MSSNHVNFDEIMDQHLDMMIRLAFKQADALELQDLEDSLNRSASDDTQADVRSAYARFLKKLNAPKQNKRRKRLPRVIAAAACIVLAIALAVPVASANFASIRSQVLELVSITQEKFTEIAFIADEDSSFTIPAGWSGDFYPTYIPEAYELIQVDSMESILTFQNSEGRFLYFSENTPDTSMSIDTENAEISHVNVQGSDAMVVVKDTSCMIMFANDYRYFLIDGQESVDEMLKIANSIRKIVY